MNGDAHFTEPSAPQFDVTMVGMYASYRALMMLKMVVQPHSVGCSLPRSSMMRRGTSAYNRMTWASVPSLRLSKVSLILASRSIMVMQITGVPV